MGCEFADPDEFTVRKTDAVSERGKSSLRITTRDLEQERLERKFIEDLVDEAIETDTELDHILVEPK